MQQTTRRLVFVLGGTFFVAGGMLVVACSTDNGSGSSGVLPTIDAQTDKGKTSSGGDDDDGSQTDGGNNADCSAAPYIRDNTDQDGGIFCPFQADKNAPDCTKDQQCCAPGTFGAPSFCATIVKSPEANNENDLRFASCKSQVPDASAPEGGWDPTNNFNAAFECSDTTSCPGTAPVCCATSQLDSDGGKVNIGPNQFVPPKGIPTACNAKQFFKIGGTRCATACSTTELQVCSKNDDSCPTGTKCMAAAGTANSGISTRYLGYCAVP